MTDIDNKEKVTVPEHSNINNRNEMHIDSDNNLIKLAVDCKDIKTDKSYMEQVKTSKEPDNLTKKVNEEVGNTINLDDPKIDSNKNVVNKISDVNSESTNYDPIGKDFNENHENMSNETSQESCKVNEAGDELINCKEDDNLIVCSTLSHDQNLEENKIADIVKSDDKTHFNISCENGNKTSDNLGVCSLHSEENAQDNTSEDPVTKDSILKAHEVTKESIMEIDKISEAETFVDILGNGLLTKKIIVNGLGRETRPTHGDSVTIQYKGWNSSGELIEENETSFVLGDGDMIQAFDLGICLAERHEEFELKTDARFAYGNYGWEQKVQPNEALVYRIKLMRVDDPPDYATFTHQNRMEAADVKRERGNYLYRREEYSLAVNSYSRAIKIIQTDPDYKKASTDPSKMDMYDLFVKITNNLAASQLKLESYDNVIETCNTILNYDASNVKALFRKGKSLSMKGNYDEAIPILKRALALENSKLIAGEIQRCYQLKRTEDEQRARVCRKMFGTGTKNSPEKYQESASNWKMKVYKYSPYIGAVLITGISVILASIAIAKSKGN